MGENKYGQLGRRDLSLLKQEDTNDDENVPFGDGLPHLVDGVLGQKGSGCVDVSCGWSHTVASVVGTPATSDAPLQESSSYYHLYGWGRNDKGQLGIGTQISVKLEDEDLLASNKSSHTSVLWSPKLLYECTPTGRKITTASCGAESTSIVDEDCTIWGCGWNEHGNVGIGSLTDRVDVLTAAVGAKLLVGPIPAQPKNLTNDGAFVRVGAAKVAVAVMPSKKVLLASGGAHLLASWIET